MATWGEILVEIQASQQERAARGQLGPDFDRIRFKYINRLRELTGRAVIAYASGWLARPGLNDPAIAVEPDDVHGLMECCHGVPERQLDLLIHSPGGSPEAAEQMMNYLRTQFDEIRCFVPLQAKSAATMMALGCDEIVMGLHSELGPIDPQILVPVPEGQRFAPAHAILRDFDRAKADIQADVNTLGAWTPILRGYAGGLLEYCQQQIELSQDIVAGWLERYMLRTRADSSMRAREIAQYFGGAESYDRFRTHGRPIRVEELEYTNGLRIRRLESDHNLQDAVLSVYHALDFTFRGAAIKIIENHLGRRKVRISATASLVLQAQPQPPPTAPPAPSGALAPPNT